MPARLSIGEVRALAKAKGGEFLSRIYRSTRIRYPWRCANGHRWMAPVEAIRNSDSWCPYCSKGSGEECVRICFEKVFKRRFPRVWAGWIRSDTGRSLELDGFNARMGVAFEHQGQHHYHHREFFHREPGQFQRRLALDRRKSRLCRQHGIRLVKIPEVGWKFPLERLLPEVIRRCRQLGIRVPAGADRLRINYAPAWNRNRERADKAVRLLKKTVKKQKGKWLNPKWMGNRHQYQFQCASGHRWKNDYFGILSGRWCPVCRYGIVTKKKTAWWAGAGGKELRGRLFQQGQRHLIRLKEFAKKRGGECLSKEFLGFGKRHRFRCGDCGRVWQTHPNNLLVHKCWCKPCSLKKRWAERLRKLDYLGRMKAVAIKRGGQCLSNKWLGALASYRFRCGKCGREWQTKPSVILIRGGWCLSCASRRNRQRQLAKEKGKRRSPSPT